MTNSQDHAAEITALWKGKLPIAPKAAQHFPPATEWPGRALPARCDTLNPDFQCYRPGWKPGQTLKQARLYLLRPEQVTACLNNSCPSYLSEVSVFKCFLTSTPAKDGEIGDTNKSHSRQNCLRGAWHRFCDNTGKERRKKTTIFFNCLWKRLHRITKV